MLLVSTQFQKCLNTLTEDTTMQLTEQVIIKAKSVEDARTKADKFAKRGAVVRHNATDEMLQGWLDYGHTLYVTVYVDGDVYIHNHDCYPAVVLKRVRDVENYRV